MQENKKEIYLCDYHYNGKTKSFKVEAESWNEAREIIKAMGRAECVGVLYKEIHLKPTPFIARLIVKMAKFFGKNS